MYIPNLNQMTDNGEIVDFMKRFSFATIITTKENHPTATHLPFLVSVRNEQIVLTSHFAKANPQWEELLHHPVLVIFTEPHAYISPKHYEQHLNVPTWNYIAVHAYGQATLLSTPDQAKAVLENTIDNYELSYRQQWESFPEDYKLGLMKGIVAFEIAVTKVQAKQKSSQNKNANEQHKIIDALSNSSDTNEQIIAEYMTRLNRK